MVRVPPSLVPPVEFERRRLVGTAPVDILSRAETAGGRSANESRNHPEV
jgi:hypothetical protein